jgi:toxin HigB-1
MMGRNLRLLSAVGSSIRFWLRNVSQSDTLVGLWDGPMIRSFKDRRTEAVFKGESPKGFPSDLVKVARRKLRMIHRAVRLEDLRAPPANRLEALKGDRQGQHSIRINDQFRICFTWLENDAYSVEVTDYH